MNFENLRLEWIQDHTERKNSLYMYLNFLSRQTQEGSDVAMEILLPLA